MGAKSPAAINLEYQLGFKEFVSTAQPVPCCRQPMPMHRLSSDSASCRLCTCRAVPRRAVSGRC